MTQPMAANKVYTAVLRMGKKSQRAHVLERAKAAENYLAHFPQNSVARFYWGVSERV
ncbi:MAG: hypothetical protein KF770_25660 [Anaerolineae bacterium]|nr:hypothetical protein [Anaerolineae bacterium]